MTIRIVTDSACDLPEAMAKKFGITIVPLTYRFGDEEFVDRESLTTTQFWAKCASSPVLPETSAPAPGKFEAAFRDLVAQGATGICVVSLSSDLSATMQSAEVAAKSFAGEIPIRIVDSRSATMAEGITVLACAELAATGATLDQVADFGTAFAKRVQCWAALDTLENLKKGGRIGGVKALMASALSIKPILEIANGLIVEGGKQRTRGKALAFLVDKVRNAGNVDHLVILQADCTDSDVLLAGLREFYQGEIIIGDIGAVIGSHAGPGAIGVAFSTVS
jgi:DegV family protein with EDD domain